MLWVGKWKIEADDAGMKQPEAEDWRAEREGRGLAGGSKWWWVGELASRKAGRQASSGPGVLK